MTDSINRKKLFSWALYDWANSAYSVTVISGFFPIFFKQYWSQGTSVTTSTYYLGLANSVASLIIVITAPILGALADHTSLRKRMLVAFLSTGCLVCVSLFFTAQGMWQLAIVLYIIGSIGFSSANVLYDSMLVIVSPEQSRHRDSALGYALGYLGGGVLFLVNVVMTLNPSMFGLDSSSDAVRWSFITVGVWWAVFSIPLLIYVDAAPDNPIESSLISKIAPSLKALRHTLRDIGNHKDIWLFLAAYCLYIDGVFTIVKMGMDYGLSIGLPTKSLIIALLAVQFIGFPATLIFGRLAQGYGALKCLWSTLWIYMFITGYTYFIDSTLQLYVLAVLLGLVQGAVKSISRSIFSQLIPLGKSGEYFGFFNMVGKTAAMLGPIMVGVVALTTDNSRLGFISIAILFIGGMLLLRLIDWPDTLTNPKADKND